eukprot:115027_1
MTRIKKQYNIENNSNQTEYSFGSNYDSNSDLVSENASDISTDTQTKGRKTKRNRRTGFTSKGKNNNCGDKLKHPHNLAVDRCYVYWSHDESFADTIHRIKDEYKLDSNVSACNNMLSIQSEEFELKVNNETISQNKENNQNIGNRKRVRCTNEIEINSSPTKKKRRRFHLDKHVKLQVITGGKEQRQKYMVPKNALDKLIEKQDVENRNKNNVTHTDEQCSAPTDYYFNDMVEHIQTDDIDFLAL